ncbi:MAG: tetratricopeptide repeat protein [Microscillaceae bacterium]|nr:tetratricopeptide repeat protein [Microscillaceae bacterium]
MKYILLLFWVGLGGFLKAQTIPQNPNITDSYGKRQGKWTILYDKDWNIITEQNQDTVSFYRLIAYKDDKPIGKVYDMYANGKVQMETTLLTDRPKEINHGETIYYRTDGTKEKMQVYVQGTLVDEFIYNQDGSLIVENWQGLDSLGTLYNKQKNYGKAYEVWERAKLKAAKAFGKKHENYATSLKRLGDFFFDLGRYPQAEPYYQAASEVQKERVGEKHQDYGKALNSIGSVYVRMGNYAQAELVFQKVQEIYKTSLGENHLLYAGILHNLAVLNYDIGKYDVSEKYALESLKIREILVGKDHADYANSLTLLGNLYNSRGNYAQGKTRHEEASRIYKNKENYFYPSSLGNLAISHHYLGNYTTADSLYQEVRAISEKTNGKKHPNYARALADLGGLYKDMYKFDQAKALMLEALQIRKEIFGDKHPQYARTLWALSRLYVAMNDYAQAETLLLQVIQLHKETVGEKNLQYANYLGDLATHYLRIDDFVRAEPLFLQALDIIKEVTGKNSLDYAGYLSNLGVLYYNVNNYPRAEQCYQEALAVRAALLGKEHPDYAASLVTLGNLYESQDDFLKAETALNESVQIYLKYDGGRSSDYASALNALGNIYREKKEYQKAKDSYLQSITVHKSIQEQKNPAFATALNNLSLIYRAEKEYAKADSVMSEVLDVTKTVLGDNHINYYIFIRNKGIIKEELGDYEAAFQYYQQERDYIQNRVTNIFPAMSQKEKELFFQQVRVRMGYLAGFVFKCLENNYINKVGWLYDIILDNKGILLNTQNKIRDRIFASQDSTLLNLYQNWQNKQNTLAQLYQMPLEEKKKRGLDEIQLEEEANRVEKELSLKSEIYAGINDKTRYTWRQIQEKLKPSEVSIEVLRFDVKNSIVDGSLVESDSAFYAFLILTSETKDNPELLVLQDGLWMEGIYLQEYKRNINAQRLDKSSYNRFWVLVEQKIGKVKKIYFSPDGVYHHINLNTLWNPNTQKYLLDEVEIQIVGNTKDLITENIQQTKPTSTSLAEKQAVLLGHPKYDLSADQHQTISQNFQRKRGEVQEFYTVGEEITQVNWQDLPGTEVEVQNIHNLLKTKGWKSTMYVNENALEEVIKQVQSPAILHIATHGFFLEPIKKATRNSDSTQVFEATDLDFDIESIQNTTFGISTLSKLKSNPMMLSGLVLTGVSTYAKSSEKYQSEDGILTAYEASSLNLDHTDLVVLSACQTGEGEVVNGEGVFGLQRGFQTAGAKSILMSLWNVSDDATQALMTLFYENWISKGQTKREAFNNAQKKLRRQYPSPFYWGAFVLIGE